MKKKKTKPNFNLNKPDVLQQGMFSPFDVCLWIHL